MSASSCPRCGQPLEKQPAQYVLRRGEHFFAFEGVPVRVCLACDWRTVTRADTYVMEQALATGAVSAKGILNVPLFAFSEARRAVQDEAPAIEGASSPGLVEDAPHTELTGHFIGWAIDVHNEFGPGHEEAVYQRALAARMEKEQASFVEEPTVAVENRDGVLVGLYYPDFVVEQVLIVEIKAHGWPLTNDEIAQTIDYFAGIDCNVALLFNFGRPRLEWKRLFLPKKIKEYRRKRWGKQLR